MKRTVKFYFIGHNEERTMTAKNEADMISKCWDFCYKHNALHFEIL